MNIWMKNIISKLKISRIKSVYNGNTAVQDDEIVQKGAEKSK
jgi:hypothetical protein